ncbi:terminase large subunit [Sinorhizobium fredii]|uniref:terminase large subunit n=1 Tax=Rhizobium fredii TaxID=380 RepID=UPI0004B6AC05|nr:terminase TerL endonuclease subunit [Sinorhizobium fredii]AWM24963.1 Phage terminase large subunit [Sinorhizobium fredii CCBAU 25509]
MAGRIIAGEHQIAAAERHLRDLSDGQKRGLYWSSEAAALAIGFPPAVLSITAGAAEGKPFNLLPWQVFCTGSLFGWRRDSGRMRFRSAWVETGKGQAKSPWMAAMGLYMGGWYGVRRAEVYSIGQDRATANVLFKDAVAMCRAPIPGGDEDDDDSLVSRGDVIIRGEGDNAWKIEFPEIGGKFQSLANGQAISGPRPIMVAADEIHEFRDNSSIETWKRAIAKMPGDGLMLLGTNTPASTQIVGTEYSEFYQKVVTGEISDDEAFAFICRVDKKDRDTVFENEAVWKKSLPALGVTFPIENIRGEVNTARVLLSTAFSVKRLYFGIPIGAADFWIAEDAWSAVQGRVDPEKQRGRKCWLSLDLSDKNDLTALTAVWADDKSHLYAKTWYWTTKDGLAERALSDNAKYVEWSQDPLVDLTAVPGAVIDKTFVAAEVKKLCSEQNIEFLAFDPAGMADFIAACEQIGFPVWKYEGPDKPEGQGLKLVAHGQGKRVAFEDRALCMPRAIERLEDRILERSITIDSSPVTYMCAGNALVDADGQGNRAFDKKRSRGRIDGLVTIAMATCAAADGLPGAIPPTTSAWDDPSFSLADLGAF